METIAEQANPSIKTTREVNSTPLTGKRWADAAEEEEEAEFGDMVAWLVLHQGAGCEKFLVNSGPKALIITGLPPRQGNDPYFEEFLCCIGITAVNYRSAIIAGSNRHLEDVNLNGMSRLEAFSCCILSVFHQVNVLVVSQKGGEYYIFRSNPNHHATYVVGITGNKFGGKVKYARINCTEIGMSGMFKRVMYPCSDFVYQPSIPDHAHCQVFAYKPCKPQENGSNSTDLVNAKGSVLFEFELPRAEWNDYILPGMDNVGISRGLMIDGTYERLMDNKREMLSMLDANAKSDQICDDLRKGLSVDKVNIGIRSKFTPRRAPKAFATTSVARDQLSKTKLPTNEDKHRNEWLLHGAKLSEQTVIGMKPKELKMTGLRHWYSSRIMNCSKARLQKSGKLTATFLPGGLLTGTGLGDVILKEVVWCNNVLIPRYECYNNEAELSRSLVMICETGNCNIPGRPYLGYDHINKRLFTSDLFSTYFEKDMATNDLVELRTIVTAQIMKAFDSVGHRSTPDQSQASYTNFLPPWRKREQSGLSSIPVVHSVLNKTINTRKYVDLSTLSSIWPTITGEAYQKDCQDRNRDENGDLPEVVELRVSAEDVLLHSYSFSCTWKQPFKVTDRGFILPCGTVEPKVTHNLHQHACMLPYLGESLSDYSSLGMNCDTVPSCNLCNRRFAHYALAELCEKFGCPGSDDTQTAVDLNVGYLKLS